MSDIYECGVCGREHGDGPTICEKCYDEQVAAVARLTNDLKVNAHLLAVQTDLNREHENELARLRAENAEWRDNAAEKLSALCLERYEKGAFTFRADPDFLKLFAGYFVSILKEHNAPNYCEMGFRDPEEPDGGDIIVLVQRQFGETPARQNQRLRKENAQLLAAAQARDAASTQKSNVEHDGVPYLICKYCGEFVDSHAPDCPKVLHPLEAEPKPTDSADHKEEPDGTRTES